ncbi:hypothetical protein [Streptomyces sp. NBC_01445]|uniref:hypothetical protein n=1 Tax=Streptomyces sp. NBC_01445 TaxID=2903869 RepID=UPI002DD9C91A|nr:hypothetical protein [Streptomyces sp. NBC_01445]WSE03772.1 hypothetical protein OG574_10570 [Streptomyces sp. NBC_01445]
MVGVSDGLVDHHVQALDQAPPDAGERVDGLSPGEARQHPEVLVQRPSLDPETVVPFRNAVADKPLEEGAQFELLDVLPLADVGVDDGYPLLQPDPHLAPQRIEGVDSHDDATPPSLSPARGHRATHHCSFS